MNVCFYRYPDIGGKMVINADFQLQRSALTCVCVTQMVLILQIKRKLSFSFLKDKKISPPKKQWVQEALFIRKSPPPGQWAGGADRSHGGMGIASMMSVLRRVIWTAVNL